MSIGVEALIATINKTPCTMVNCRREYNAKDRKSLYKYCATCETKFYVVDFRHICEQ